MKASKVFYRLPSSCLDSSPPLAGGQTSQTRQVPRGATMLVALVLTIVTNVGTWSFPGLLYSVLLYCVKRHVYIGETWTRSLFSRRSALPNIFFCSASLGPSKLTKLSSTKKPTTPDIPIPISNRTYANVDYSILIGALLFVESNQSTLIPIFFNPHKPVAC
jgi:hypothetical protein